MNRFLRFLIPAALVILVAAAAVVSVVAIGAPAAAPANDPAAAQKALGTAFTYQGRLRLDGVEVDDDCDFQFALYGSEGGADQIGSTRAISAVAVAGGYFTIPSLDFGPGAFNGEARYLAISVRCPAGSGGYINLTPRQLLAPAPHALALPGLWTWAGSESPNLVGGYGSNVISPAVSGGTIGGGGTEFAANRVTDDYGTVAGGKANLAGNDSGDGNDAEHATVGGGDGNTASGPGATVAGGGGNSASGFFSVVGGGGANSASGEYNATVAGGYGNTAGASDSTVGGGNGNSISAPSWAGTVAGGYGNTIAAGTASIGGGLTNTVTFTGDAAAIAGGDHNTASAYAAAVPGGANNTAGGAYSLAAGRRAQALHDGAFVWADGQDADFASAAANQFAVRAGGGVSFDLNGAPFLVDGQALSFGGSPYDNVLVVAKSGGDYTSIQAALNSISDASASNRYLVWVAPGVYAEQVTMKAHVDIQGAGRDLVKIAVAGLTTAVTAASDAELAHLTVENSGGTANVFGIQVIGASPWLHDLAVTAAGGMYPTAIAVSSGTPIIQDVTAVASGGSTQSTGIDLGSSSAVLERAKVEVSGAASFQIGLRVGQGTPALSQVDISVDGTGGTYAYGLLSAFADAQMSDIRLTVTGDGTNNYGLYASGAGAPAVDGLDVTIYGSVVGNYAIRAESNADLTVRDFAVDAYGGYNAIGVWGSSNVTVTLLSGVIQLSTSTTGGTGLSFQPGTWAEVAGVAIFANTPGNNLVAGVIDSDALIANSHLEASGGSSNVGLSIWTTAGHTATLTVNNSQVYAAGYTLSQSGTTTTLIGGTLLSGGEAWVSGGTAVCAGVFDETYTFYASTCP